MAGEGLQSSTTATTLRVEDGERILTDGPFVETKEQIGGFYVIECKDLDEAIDWAAKLPSAEGGDHGDPAGDGLRAAYDDPQARSSRGRPRRARRNGLGRRGRRSGRSRGAPWRP